MEAKYREVIEEMKLYFESGYNICRYCTMCEVFHITDKDWSDCIIARSEAIEAKYEQECFNMEKNRTYLSDDDY